MRHRHLDFPAFLLLGLLLFSGRPLVAQTPTPVLDETFASPSLPPTWSTSGRGLAEPQFRTVADTVTVISLNEADVWLHPPILRNVASVVVDFQAGRASDNYVVVLQQRVSPDTVWTPVARLARNGSADVAQSRTWNVMRPGSVEFRLGLESFVSGEFQLDRLQAYAMTPAQLQSATLRSDLDRAIVRLDSLSKANQAQPYDDFVRSLQVTEEAMIDDLRRQRNVVRENLDLAGYTSFATAVGRRNQMANPMFYSQFGEFVQRVSNILPPIRRSRLADLGGMFRTALQGGGALMTGNFAGAVNSLKDLVVAAFTNASLQDAGISRGQRRGLVARGVGEYERISTFLDVMVDENARAGRLNQQLDSIRGAAELQYSDSRRHLEETLRWIGSPNDTGTVNALILGDPDVTGSVNAQVRTFVARQQGSRDTFSGRPSETQRNVLERARTVQTTTGRHLDQAAGLQNEVLRFTDAFISDLDRPNPFAAPAATSPALNGDYFSAPLLTASRDQWGRASTEGLTTMRRARQAFAITHTRSSLEAR